MDHNACLVIYVLNSVSTVRTLMKILNEDLSLDLP